PTATATATAGATTTGGESGVARSAMGAVRAYPLPGATAPVTLDYLAFDAKGGKVWVPIGDTGSVGVFDVARQGFDRLEGLASAEGEYKGKTRRMGPSAASVGDGVVYVGNRATAEVCPVDATRLARGACVKLPVPTDGVSYVPSAKEVW